MKRFHFLFSFTLLLGAALFVAWVFLKTPSSEKKDDEKKDDAEKSRIGLNEKGETVIKLDAEMQKRLGLGLAPLAEATNRAQIAAFGRVVDPSPLMMLHGELATAESALTSSKAEAERLTNLFKSGENIARKNLETAQTQFRSDEIKVLGLHRRLSLEWGEGIARLGSDGLHDLLDALVSGHVAFVRVDVLAGDALTRDPSAARVAILGREEQPMTAASIAPAVATDPKTQAQGFLLQIKDPPFPLRSGAAASAWIELPGDEQKGVVIPRDAVVRHVGASWVYVQESDGEFVRREVAHAVPAEKGWFVPHGFEPKENVVAIGAQAILSEELKAQFGGGD